MVRGDVVERAFAAWFRGSKTGLTPQYPSHDTSAEVTLPNGKRYVLMANGYRVLGCYRVRTNGLLRRLKRWPKAVEKAAGWEGVV
jgi:hypothetical protein